MQQAWETEQHNVILQKIPAGKRGFFYAGVFSDHPDLYGKKAGGRRAPGTGGGAARPAAGVCVSAGAGRRLGRAVRGADALRAGADTGLWGGLLCRGGCRGGAGAAGAELRCADGGEHLPALRAGRGGGCAVALAGPVRPGGAGRLRHAGGERRLLCGGGGERRSAPAALRRGRRTAFSSCCSAAGMPCWRRRWGWASAVSRPKSRGWAACCWRPPWQPHGAG